MPETVKLDEARQRRAKRYARQRRALWAVELAVSALLVVAFLLSGGSLWLKQQVVAIVGPWRPAVVFGYFVVLFLGYTVVMLPLSLLGGFVLPHRYSMSNQTLAAWAQDQVKATVLALVLGGLAIEVIYALLAATPNWWWLWAALFLLLFTVVLSALSPVLLVPLFYRLTPLDDPALVERLRRLGEQAGTTITGVYTINLSSKSPAANAMVMGLGRTRRIALGDTLLQHYTHDEIEMILAHELGHHVHGDLGKGIIVQSVLTLAGLWLAHLLLRWGSAALGFDGVADIAAFPLLAIALGLFALVTMPLSNGYSRWRERLADAYALRATESPQSMITVMAKLANQNLADADPPQWVTWLLASHPPIGQRIAMAQDASGGSESGGSEVGIRWGSEA